MIASLVCLYTLGGKTDELFAIWVLTSTCLMIASTIHYFGKMAILKCVKDRKDAAAKKNEIEIISNPIPKVTNVEMTNLNFHGNKKDLHSPAYDISKAESEEK